MGAMRMDRVQAGAPRVWAFLGNRAGDNAQVLALANLVVEASQEVAALLGQ